MFQEIRSSYLIAVRHGTGILGRRPARHNPDRYLRPATPQDGLVAEHDTGNRCRPIWFGARCPLYGARAHRRPGSFGLCLVRCAAYGPKTAPNLFSYGDPVMKSRKALFIALYAAALGVASLPIPSSAAVDVFLNVAPPAPRVEVVPAPRQGYVWAPGYWDARGRRHAWIGGHWERVRRGQHYVSPRWVERNNGWYLERGRWNPGDRDRDGVPNYRDRAPDNPNRR
jgi:hypothetical protein